MASATRARRDIGRVSLRPVPPALRPVLKAFLLGYGSAVGPRLLSLLAHHLLKKNVDRDGKRKGFGESLQLTLASGLGWNKFPAFCAALLGGSTLLEVPVRRLLQKLLGSNISALTLTRLARSLATFFAAAFSISLLQSRKTHAFSETTTPDPDNPASGPLKTTHYAGRTLDLTLFTAVRAVDVVVRALWSRRRASLARDGKWTGTERLLASMADPALFAISSAAIMWAWFYQPDALPKTYTKWITSAATVDMRLIEALRRCRSGIIQYGKDTGPESRILTHMATDLGLPAEWGNPATHVPFPCQIVHMKCGPSCEYHAVSRLVRAFTWSMATYLPLNLLFQLRKPSLKGLRRAVTSAARSSSFLATFIALFYYGVCLTRTRIGPKLLGSDNEARQRIDGGYCVGTGCFLCGWSVLLEAPRRRPELALFVAPRALATVLPRRYSKEQEWREVLAFAAGAAVLFTCAAEDKKRVRGVLGRVIGMVMQR